MNTIAPIQRQTTRSRRNRRGSVLVIVLWIAFGLVSIALYFGHTMSFELQAADNSVAMSQANMATESAARYVSYVLANNPTPGLMPDINTYESEEVPVGESTFWLIGRSDQQNNNDVTPYFGLVDEASKLNLNTATVDMLELLPRMTPELAAAIVDWRDADSDPTQNGAESDTYSRFEPPYMCKNAPFESLEELRMVSGADMEILCGRDLNRNGVLDANESSNSIPVTVNNSSINVLFDPGIFEYLTVYSREPNKRSDGTARANVNSTADGQLAALLQDRIGGDRATQITARLANRTDIGSVLEFYSISGMTEDEFALVASDLTVTNSPYLEGLVNVNTASATVLACIPGIGVDKAPSLVSYRQSNPNSTNSIAWVTKVLDPTNIVQAGPYLTGLTYQFNADIAATGHYGRGYRRTQFIFDTSEGTPKIIYRRDLSGLGWALGPEVRQRQLLANSAR